MEGNIIDVGVDFGVIQKSGSWFSYNGEKLGQGKDKVRALLEEDEALAAELSEKIMAHYSGEITDTVEDVSAEDLFDEE